MATQAQRKAETIAAILLAAETFFARDGFEATTIDLIAASAGVAKGAVYHHFESKTAIFVSVLDMFQHENARRTIAGARAAKTPVDAIKLGTRAFLKACLEPNIRRIVLVDGPVVLGWQRWREIDGKYFNVLLQTSVAAALGGKPSKRLDRESQAIANLLIGATTEAALNCVNAANPKAAMREYLRAFDILLVGLLPRA